MVTFSVLLWNILSPEKGDKVSGLLQGICWLVLTLLELSVERLQPKDGNKTRIIWLLPMGTWLLFGIFIVNFYKGDMYSYLTVQVDPSTPQNLYELVKGEMPILSIAWSLASMEEKYKIRSTLTTSIIPTLLADEGISAQKQDVYNRLRNITLFPSEVRFKLFWSLSVGEFFKNFNHTSYEREDTFAVVDHTDTFKLFGQNLGYFGNFKPAIAHSAMHFYTMRSIWIVRKNFFYNVFTHGLTSLVEGGIYERWSKNTRIQRPLLECYAAFLKMKKRDNKLTLIGCSAGCAEATTLKQVTVPFDLYLVMVLGAVGIFMKELKLILKEVLRSGYYSILLKIRTLEPHLRFMMAKVLYL